MEKSVKFVGRKTKVFAKGATTWIFIPGMVGGLFKGLLIGALQGLLGLSVGFGFLALVGESIKEKDQ